jgi:transposase
MNLHKNARLTPQGRLLMVRRIDEQGWKVADAAAAAGLSTRRAYHWLGRYRAGGERMLCDGSSTPARYRAPVPAERVAEIERLRRERLTGPQIARQLGMPRSTVGLVLRRLGLGRLKALDAPPPAIRYERERPGELIHIDSKKLGRIDGIGHRITGHHAGHHRARGAGWEVLHVCIGGVEHPLPGLSTIGSPVTGASSAMMSWPGSPRTRMRPIGPGAPMRCPACPVAVSPPGGRRGPVDGLRGCVSPSSRQAGQPTISAASVQSLAAASTRHCRARRRTRPARGNRVACR